MLLFVSLGALIGVLSVAFIRGIYGMETVFDRFPLVGLPALRSSWRSKFGELADLNRVARDLRLPYAELFVSFED